MRCCNIEQLAAATWACLSISLVILSCCVKGSRMNDSEEEEERVTP